MRLMSLLPVVLVLSMPGSAVAQEWLEYYSRADFFLVNIPGAPTVRDISYPTEFGVTLPGHAHVYEYGPSRYSVTVIDYANIQKIHADRLQNCKAYPNLCVNPWVGELRGALDYAASSFLKRDGKVKYYGYGSSDRIEGRRIQLTNPDRSLTFAAVYMHENRLYILESTEPAGSPPPALFQQSMGFLDKDGRRVRYESIYANGYPPPPREQAEGRLAGC